MKKYFLIVFFALITNNLMAGTSIEVGQQVTLYCTQKPPQGGWFDRVAFILSDASDNQYLSIVNNYEDQSAVLIGRAPKESVKIEVICSYAYMGSYDKQIHVGSFSYYEYVSVTGGVSPTSVKITSPTTMEVGETITLHADLSPNNATTVFSWGTVSTLGKPFNFTLSYSGCEAQLYSKGEGTVYVVVETDNGKLDIITITALSSKITEISFMHEYETIGLGQSQQLDVEYQPSKSSPNNLSWTSSNPDIVKVSSDGTVLGVSAGVATITASSKSDSSIQSTCRVKCLPVLNIEGDNYKKITGLQNSYNVGDRLPVNNDPSIIWTLDNVIINNISDPLLAGLHTIQMKEIIDGKITYSIKYTINVEQL